METCGAWSRGETAWSGGLRKAQKCGTIRTIDDGKCWWEGCSWGLKGFVALFAVYENELGLESIVVPGFTG